METDGPKWINRNFTNILPYGSMYAMDKTSLRNFGTTSPAKNKLHWDGFNIMMRK